MLLQAGPAVAGKGHPVSAFQYLQTGAWVQPIGKLSALYLACLALLVCLARTLPPLEELQAKAGIPGQSAGLASGREGCQISVVCSHLHAARCIVSPRQSEQHTCLLQKGVGIRLQGVPGIMRFTGWGGLLWLGMIEKAMQQAGRPAPDALTGERQSHHWHLWLCSGVSIIVLPLISRLTC